VIKNGLFCHLAAHFIDLLHIFCIKCIFSCIFGQIHPHILKIQLHKIADPDDEHNKNQIRCTKRYLSVKVGFKAIILKIKVFCGNYGILL